MRSASFATILLLTPLLAQEPAWLTNFEDAKALAKKETKPIVAAFVGSDWCGYSIKMKEEVFSTPEFAKLAQKVVLLEVDFPKQKQLTPELKEQNRQLAKQYGINRHGTALVLDATGKQLGAPVDYTKGGAVAWIRIIEERMAAGAAKAKGAATAEASAWTTDYDAALARAKAEKKIVLADFTGSDWCGWCIKLKEEVFAKPEFAAWAKDNVILLEVDFPKQKKLDAKLTKQNDELARRFHVDGYPTIVFVDAKGDELGRSGYLEGGPAAWIANAERTAGITPKKAARQGS